MSLSQSGCRIALWTLNSINHYHPFSLPYLGPTDLPANVLQQILTNGMSGISGSLPGRLTIAEISLTRPTFQDVTSTTMTIIVWSSVGAAIGLVLAVLLGYCIATQARYCGFFPNLLHNTDLHPACTIF